MIGNTPFIIVNNQRISHIGRSPRSDSATGGRTGRVEQPCGAVDQVTISREARVKPRQKQAQSKPNSRAPEGNQNPLYRFFKNVLLYSYAIISNRFFICISLFSLLSYTTNLIVYASSGHEKKSERMTISESISVGDQVLCRCVYENLEDPGYGPSHRTITEITGIVTEARESEYLLNAQSVGLSRFILKNGEWIYDASLLRGPSVRKGDVFVCHPKNEKQRRLGSKIRQQVTIEKLP